MPVGRTSGGGHIKDGVVQRPLVNAGRAREVRDALSRWRRTADVPEP